MGGRYRLGKDRGGVAIAFVRAARKNGIPLNLAYELMQQESRGRQSARSPVGAIGLMQLMPATAKELGVNPYDPIQNVEGGIRYLAQKVRHHKSKLLAVAAYNAGSGAVKKHGGVPPYKETQHYVARICGRSKSC